MYTQAGSVQNTTQYTITHSLFISYITLLPMSQIKPVIANKKSLEGQQRNLKNGFSGREEGNRRMIS